LGRFWIGAWLPHWHQVDFKYYSVIFESAYCFSENKTSRIKIRRGIGWFMRHWFNVCISGCKTFELSTINDAHRGGCAGRISCLSSPWSISKAQAGWQPAGYLRPDRGALGTGHCTRHRLKHQDPAQGQLSHCRTCRHQRAQFLDSFQPLFKVHA
jgi:hypothetical protein